MEPNSHFDESQPGQKPAGKSSLVLMKERIMGYVVIVLIFVFFSIPFAGLSIQYYKYRMPSRFLAWLQLFLPW